MAQGRGSAGGAIFTVAVLLCQAVHSMQVDEATYTVGDSGGWTYNVNGWPKGKSFKAGDTLVFNYDPTQHNVVVVNTGGYTGCTTPAGAKVYRTGQDSIKLAKGLNLFICSVPGHCQSGMKIAIRAT